MSSNRRGYPVGAAELSGAMPEVRSAAALEYIAYYLDRIDGHLEAIANQASQVPTTLRVELSSLRATIANHR